MLDWILQFRMNKPCVMAQEPDAHTHKREGSYDTGLSCAAALQQEVGNMSETTQTEVRKGADFQNKMSPCFNPFIRTTRWTTCATQQLIKLQFLHFILKQDDLVESGLLSNSK